MLQAPTSEFTYSFATAGDPTGLAAGALLADGHTDLAVTDSTDPLPQFFEGQGQSQFVLKTVTVTNAPDNLISAKGVVTGDFTGNGTVDLLFLGLTNGEEEPTTEDVVYLNQGNGTFNAVVSQDGGGCDCTGQESFDAESIAIGNFNGDKLNDIAFISNPPPSTESPASMGIALNAGNGQFPTFTYLALPSGTEANPDTFTPTAITSGNFDGHVDLLVAGTYQTTTCTIPGATGSPFNGYIAIYPGNGSGSFGAPQLYCAGENPASLAVGDFNKDGNLDVIVGNSGYVPVGTAVMPSIPKSVQVLLGNGQDAFSPGQTIYPTSQSLADGNTSPGNPVSLSVADFNGDSYPDFSLLDSYGTLYFYRNTGASAPGQFGQTQVSVASAPSIPAGYFTDTGDVNSDGYPDLVSLVSTPNDGSTTGYLFVYTNSASAQASLTTPPQSLEAGTRHVTASFSADSNFPASTSTPIAVTVSQTVPTIIWDPMPVVYPNGLGSGQLNAASPGFNCPACFTYTPGAGTVLPLPTASSPTSTLGVVFTPPDTFDYATVSASANVAVTLPAPIANVNAPTTANPGAQPTIGFTFNSYPVDATVNVTLSFTPTSSNPPSSNGSVQFPNGTTNDSFVIPANTASATQQITFSAGLVEGTVTVTFVVTANGTNITPANLTTPVSITVPPSVPDFQDVTLQCGSTGIQLVVQGYSSTREISGGQVVFTAASGKSLQASTFPISGVQQLFTTYYQSAASDAGGSQFTLTQPFTLSSGNISDIGGASITLTNGQGQAQSSTVSCTTSD